MSAYKLLFIFSNYCTLTTWRPPFRPPWLPFKKSRFNFFCRNSCAMFWNKWKMNFMIFNFWDNQWECINNLDTFPLKLFQFLTFIDVRKSGADAMQSFSPMMNGSIYKLSAQVAASYPWKPLLYFPWPLQLQTTL